MCNTAKKKTGKEKENIKEKEQNKKVNGYLWNEKNREKGRKVNSIVPL
jgi:hypothetical protein